MPQIQIIDRREDPVVGQIQQSLRATSENIKNQQNMKLLSAKYAMEAKLAQDEAERERIKYKKSFVDALTALDPSMRAAYGKAVDEKTFFEVAGDGGQLLEQITPAQREQEAKTRETTASAGYKERLNAMMDKGNQGEGNIAISQYGPTGATAVDLDTARRLKEIETQASGIPTEKAGLTASSQSAQGTARSSQEDNEQLSVATRRGGDTAVAARISKIPWANK
jgi:hypothetical protein